MSDSTRLGITITANDTSQASLKQLKGTLKEMEALLKSVSGTARDANGTITASLQGEINALRAAIAQQTALKGAVTQTTAAMQEQGRAAAAAAAQMQNAAEAQIALMRRIHAAYLELTGGEYNRQARLADIRDKMSDVPRAAMDAALWEMATKHKVGLLHNDNPVDMRRRDYEAAIPVGNQPRSLLWIDRKPDFADKAPAAATEAAKVEATAQAKAAETATVKAEATKAAAASNEQLAATATVAATAEKVLDSAATKSVAGLTRQHRAVSAKTTALGAFTAALNTATNSEMFFGKAGGGAGSRAEAEYLNRDIDLIAAKQRAEANYIKQGMDAAAAKARAEAEYENRDAALRQRKLDREYIAARQQAEIDNYLFDQAAKARARAAAAQSGGGNASIFGKELGHGVSLFDEAARGQRGAMFASLGAAARDAGFGVTTLATSVGGLVAVMGGLAVLRTAEEMGKWATQTRAAANAVGMTIEQYSALQGAFRLMGLKADEADASLRKVGETFATAIANPSSKAAEALHNMGISQAEVAGEGKTLQGALMLLADAITHTSASEERLDNLREIMGRGFERLLPILQNGRGGFIDYENKAKEVHLTLTEETAPSLEKTGEAVDSLSGTIRGNAIAAFEAWAPVIEKVTTALGGMLNMALKAIAAVGAAVSAASKATDNAAKLTVEANAAAQATGQMPILSPFGRTAKPYGLGTPPASFLEAAAASAAGLPPPPAKGAPQGLVNVLPAQGGATGLRAVQPLTPPETAMEALERKMAADELAAVQGAKSKQDLAELRTKAQIADLQKALNDNTLLPEDRSRVQRQLSDALISLKRESFSGGGGGGSAKQGYEDFAAAERLKLQNAQGNADAITAIYNDWAAKAAGVYKQHASTVLAIEKEKIQAIHTLHMQQIRDEAKLEEDLNKAAGVMAQAGAISGGRMIYAGQKTLGGVEAPTGEGVDALASQAQAIEARMQGVVAKLMADMKASAGDLPAQREDAQEILNVVTQAKGQEVALYNKAAEAAIKAAQKSTEALTKFFDNLGSQFEGLSDSLVKALIAPQIDLIKQGLTTRRFSMQGNEIRQAVAKMLVEGVADAAKSAESAVGQMLAGFLSKSLNIPISQGGGLGSLLGSGLGKLLGIGTTALPDAAQFGLGGAALATAGTTLNTAGATLNSAGVSLTSAAAALSGSATSGAAAGGGGLLGGIGTFFGFARGGIVPSAAGGMVAGGLGGTLAILHPREMVLPAHLSNGIQQMIQGGRGGGNAQLNYSPTINTAGRGRGGTGMTRSEFAQMMSAHSGAMFGEARNMMRQGWRPA